MVTDVPIHALYEVAVYVTVCVSLQGNGHLEIPPIDASPIIFTISLPIITLFARL